MRLFAVLMLSAIVLASANSAPAAEICFSGEEASRLVVEVETGRNLQEQVELYRQAVLTLEEKSQAQGEALLLKDQALRLSVEQLTLKDRVIREKDRIIEEQKPGFFGTLVNILGAVGVGVVIGVLL